MFDFFIVGYLSKKNEDIYTTVDAIFQQNTNFTIRFSNLDVEKAFFGSNMEATGPYFPDV